jgi:hypothetical protein
VALPRIGLNEGSLLRRTLLHVGTFVLGSVAFIGVTSFVLVSVARGIVSPHTDGADGETVGAVASAGVKPPLPGLGAGAPLSRPGHRAGRGPVALPATSPSKDD